METPPRKSYSGLLWPNDAPGPSPDSRVRPMRPVSNGKQITRPGPVERPGDGFTVNATSGAAFQQTSGASYREILDLSDWDRSMTTNVPGESGDPSSPHYSDLLADWAAGKYHPLPYTRKAVEAATVERMTLTPPVIRP